MGKSPAVSSQHAAAAAGDAASRRRGGLCARGVHLRPVPAAAAVSAANKGAKLQVCLYRQERPRLVAQAVLDAPASHQERREPPTILAAVAAATAAARSRTVFRAFETRRLCMFK